MELLFHPDSIRKIAEEAIEKKTGARGLKRIIENAINDALFENAGTLVRYVVVDANLKIHTFDASQDQDAFNIAEQQ
jgi:ATP-dependent Clp protease ATP-binding subunit ClpX